jgi:hypothetical protein
MLKTIGNISLFSLFLSTLALGGTQPPCKVLEEGMRVDTPEAIQAMQDVCEVKGGIGIFTKGIEKISFPRLVSANVINIEAEGLQAMNLPQLNRVNYLYLSGAELIAVNLSELRTAQSIYIHSRRLKQIDFSHLGRVGKLNIQNNPALEFIFLDRLYEVAQLLLEGNPSLVPGVEDIITTSTHIQTKEEAEAIQKGQENIEYFKKLMLEQAINQPPLPPTGHPTYFRQYYSYYPHYYWGFWHMPWWY